MVRIFAVGVLLFASVIVARTQPLEEKSVVFYALDPNSLVTGFQAEDSVVRGMVDSLVRAVTRQPTVAEAWRSLAGPKDVVGIKVAAAPGDVTGTHVSVVLAVSRGLQSAGVSPRNILVWDRNEVDLINAGFSKNSPDYQLRWTDPTDGYDPEAPISAPVLGKLIWGDSRFGKRDTMRAEDLLSSGDQLSSTSYFARVLTKDVTKVINIPSLCDSFMTGLNGAIANVTLWNVDNWRRFIKPPTYGDPYLAEIYIDPRVRGKVVLTLMDGLTLQFAGEPVPNPNFSRPNHTLYASDDPVALDAVALRTLEEYRVGNQLPRIGGMAGHVESAAAMGLGRFYENEIELVRVGL